MKEFNFHNDTTHRDAPVKAAIKALPIAENPMRQGHRDLMQGIRNAKRETLLPDGRDGTPELNDTSMP